MADVAAYVRKLRTPRYDRDGSRLAVGQADPSPLVRYGACPADTVVLNPQPRHHRQQQPQRATGIGGRTGQRRHVLGKVRAAVTRAGIQKLQADARVGADVRTPPLGQPGESLALSHGLQMGDAPSAAAASSPSRAKMSDYFTFTRIAYELHPHPPARALAARASVPGRHGDRAAPGRQDDLVPGRVRAHALRQPRAARHT